jgi:hypothetical protein
MKFTAYDTALQGNYPWIPFQGFETITKYGKSFHNGEGTLLPKSYCFDDLGFEKEAIYYGNECDVMKEIILSRYDLFESIGMITHFTTNLSLEELETRYGESVMSRLEAMMTFVEFDKATPDKRRPSVKISWNERRPLFREAFNF